MQSMNWCLGSFSLQEEYQTRWPVPFGVEQGCLLSPFMRFNPRVRIKCMGKRNGFCSPFGSHIGPLIVLIEKERAHKMRVYRWFGEFWKALNTVPHVQLARTRVVVDMI